MIEPLRTLNTGCSYIRQSGKVLNDLLQVPNIVVYCLLSCTPYIICIIQGQAFISKPSEVVFQDFELGKTYRKKLQLTNISYSFNYCKLIGVTDNLKDFVSIEFNPPGSISAGLTCHMVVIFEPKVCSYIIHVIGSGKRE